MNTCYDLIIAGGGIHGVGVAQAAAAAGHSILLLEKKGLAAGTSSRSSKLIHGGLRYLEYGQFGLVREMLRERALLLKNGPDLVRLVPFYLPVYRTTRRRPWQLRLGLSLYALLGSGTYRTVPRQRWSTLDGLRLEGLQAVLQYREAQTDDARLTRAVMHSAQALGAELRCPASLVAATAGADSVVVTVAQEGKQETLQGRILINAAGPWVNLVLGRVSPAIRPLAIDLVQGAHLILRGPPVSGAYYLEAEADGRGVFVMPWQGHNLIGSTESLFLGEPDFVQPRPEEISYLEQVARDYFPNTPRDITGQFAGLRVLPAGADGFWHRSRSVVLHQDEAVPRVLSIYGGKLTNYRATALKVMKKLQPWLPVRKKIADTAELFLDPGAGD